MNGNATIPIFTITRNVLLKTQKHIFLLDLTNEWKYNINDLLFDKIYADGSEIFIIGSFSTLSMTT